MSCNNLVTICKRLFILLGLILLAILYQQGDSLRSSKYLMILADDSRDIQHSQTATELKIVGLEKQVSDCQKETNIQANLLKIEKDAAIRQVNETLMSTIKSLEQEKKQTEQQQQLNNTQNKQNYTTIVNNGTVVMDRHFFHYMAVSLQNTFYPGVENYSRYTVARLGMSHLAGIEPLKPEYGPVINNVTLLRYPLTIPPCRDDVPLRKSVFLAVISAAGNFVRRNLTRQTWRHHLKVEYHNSSMRLAGFAFILGLTDNQATQKLIENENEIHGDIIQIEMADFYRNLSLKVAGLFNWLYKYCHQKIDFLFKVDDDVYVNVRNLVQFVQSHNQSDCIYGNSAGNLFPTRGGKWGVTVEEWPWKDYPRYFFGPGVLFPGRTILPLLAAFQTTPMMPIDDVYYSGICTEKAGVKIHYSTNHTNVFAMGLHAIPDPCDVRLAISWLTVSTIHMNNSHISTDDFYQNRTQCVIASTTNGTKNITIDHNQPVHFYFV